MPTSVALGPLFEAFIKDQIASGRYNNASEVVRDGLRMLQDHEELRRLKLDALRNDIQMGVDSGPGRLASDVFDQLETKYMYMADRHKK